MENRIAACTERFLMKYPNSFAAQLEAAKGKIHYCNWLSVKKWETTDEDGETYLHQNLVCPDCGHKKTISHKMEKKWFEQDSEPAKCPCGEEATIIHGTKGYVCGECARN
jgi:DNA-directed RNA polymerase subunit RPC12/RpoP